MTISEDLFLAILSLDSYGRGYGAGIKLPSDATEIGTATLKDVDLPAGSQSAGFFAQTYTWNGKTIISYRGTNFTSGAAVPDIANGWAIAPGDFRASQFALSTQFLSAVAATATGDIVLTGHSLGGAQTVH